MTLDESNLTEIQDPDASHHQSTSMLKLSKQKHIHSQLDFVTDEPRMFIQKGNPFKQGILKQSNSPNIHKRTTQQQANLDSIVHQAMPVPHANTTSQPKT
jgi:hypothetical protein